MIQSLKDLFDKISTLPNDLQEQLALEISRLLSNIEWDELLNHPKSEKLLETLSSEALEEHRANETIDGDEVFGIHEINNKQKLQKNEEIISQRRPEKSSKSV